MYSLTIMLQGVYWIEYFNNYAQYHLNTGGIIQLEFYIFLEDNYNVNQR